MDKTGSTTALLFSLYDLLAPMILCSSVRIFSCEEYDDGTASLIADRSIMCHGAQYRNMQVFAFGVVFVYLLFCPYMAYATLKPKRKRLNPRADSELAALNRRNTDSSLDGLRSIVGAYRPHLW